MMLTEDTTVPDASLPVEPFKAHLRLGTGFGEDSLQESVLRGFLRAAIAAIEARTGKVLIKRAFSLQVTEWRTRSAQVFPVAPVVSVERVISRDGIGVESEIAPERYRLEADTQRPTLRPVGTLLPIVVQGGTVTVRFVAGMAPDWDELPVGLGQAVLMLAAHYYEHRSDTALGDFCMPFGGDQPDSEISACPDRTWGWGMKHLALSRKLVLEAPQRVSDGAGGFTQVWSPLGTLWADIRPAGGRERAQAGVAVSVAAFRMVVRGAPVGSARRPSPEQRFRDGTRVFGIRAVTEYDPAGHYPICFAEEEVAA